MARAVVAVVLSCVVWISVHAQGKAPFPKDFPRSYSYNSIEDRVASAQAGIIGRITAVRSVKERLVSPLGAVRNVPPMHMIDVVVDRVLFGATGRQIRVWLPSLDAIEASHKGDYVLLILAAADFESGTYAVGVSGVDRKFTSGYFRIRRENNRQSVTDLQDNRSLFDPEAPFLGLNGVVPEGVFTAQLRLESGLASRRLAIGRFASGTPPRGGPVPLELVTALLSSASRRTQHYAHDGSNQLPPGAAASPGKLVSLARQSEMILRGTVESVKDGEEEYIASEGGPNPVPEETVRRIPVRQARVRVTEVFDGAAPREVVVRSVGPYLLPFLRRGDDAVLFGSIRLNSVVVLDGGVEDELQFGRSAPGSPAFGGGYFRVMRDARGRETVMNIQGNKGLFYPGMPLTEKGEDLGWNWGTVFEQAVKSFIPEVARQEELLQLGASPMEDGSAIALDLFRELCRAFRFRRTASA